MRCVDTVGEWMGSRGFLAPGARVLAAVSGGSDSIALLEILSDLSTERGFALAAAHLDHGIRPEAARERALVERRAAALGVALFVGAADVPAEARRLRAGVEETARLARYRFLEACASSWGATAVALGHTRDDQVETVLLHIVRGSGVRGLAGMPARRGIFVRPLLGCARAELRAFLRARGVRYAVDPSNRDASYLRNRIRAELLPLLRRRFNPRADEALLRLAANAAEEREALEAPLRALLDRRAGPDGVRLPLSRLARLAPFEIYLLLDGLLRDRFGVARDVEKRHFDACKRLVREGRSGSRAMLPHGIEAVREQRHLLLRGRAAPAAPAEALVPGPGRHPLPGWGLAARVEIRSPRGVSLRSTAVSAWFSGVAFPLRVRPRRPGDRIAPFGMRGRRKLSDLMIDRKIPASLRGSIPVLEDAAGILWVPGVAAAEDRRVDPRAKRAVRISISRRRSKF